MLNQQAAALHVLTYFMAIRRIFSPAKLWCGRDRVGDRRVTWVELFFDLVFVAAVAQVGSPLAADYSFHELWRYGFLLLVIWWAWNGYAMYATRFDSDDGLQRTLTLLQMIAVIFMAANAEAGLDTVSSAGFAAAYAVMRVILVLQYVRASMLMQARRLAGECALGFGVAAMLWFASAIVPVPWRYVFWAAALTIDIGTAIVASRHTEGLPPDAAHLPERFGLFTLILLGESIVSIMRGIQAQHDWTLPAATTAFLGIGLIFGIWWWYFEGAAAAAHRHIRSRRDVHRFEVWNYAHLPLYLGLALTGVGIEHVVRTGAALPLYAEEAWLLCGAAATAMIALTVLAATSESRRRSTFGFQTTRSLVVSLVPLTIPAVAPFVSPALVVASLAAVCALQSVLVQLERRLTPDQPRGRLTAELT